MKVPESQPGQKLIRQAKTTVHARLRGLAHINLLIELLSEGAVNTRTVGVAMGTSAAASVLCAGHAAQGGTTAVNVATVTQWRSLSSGLHERGLGPRLGSRGSDKG